MDIVTIDGPAGSGKSVCAAALARRLAWRKLDTGAMYRSLALFASWRGVDPEDGETLATLASDLPLRFEGERVLLDDRDVSTEIRSSEAGTMASRVSAHPAVRRALLPVQRRLASVQPCVAEGRDLGTVVFPDARAKFFLVAGPETRAARRLKDLRALGQDTSLEEVLKAQRERDARDENRAVAPLRKAGDAIEIDTSDLTIEEVVERMYRHVIATLAH